MRPRWTRRLLHLGLQDSPCGPPLLCSELLRWLTVENILQVSKVTHCLTKQYLNAFSTLKFIATTGVNISPIRFNTICRYYPITFRPQKYANNIVTWCIFPLYSRVHFVLCHLTLSVIFFYKEFSFLSEMWKATFDKGAAPLLTQFCDKCALSTAHRHFPFAYLYFQQFQLNT